jgi:hypothetical protein
MTPVDRDNRMHAAWEKLVTIGLTLYDANANWWETLPLTAPRDLDKMADDLLAAACALSAIAREIEADRSHCEQAVRETAHTITEALAASDRDKLTQRLG